MSSGSGTSTFNTWHPSRRRKLHALEVTWVTWGRFLCLTFRLVPFVRDASIAFPTALRSAQGIPQWPRILSHRITFSL
ncbi:hypothetical protein [Desulfoscipio gibsoniae]|uniref:hypothetical protein n=1 Tax=Desulfoscipio gibsoniae TaxID=102134 RepID=UPI0012FEB6B3|nr:hypothetical protein [Desulfoscipio gibsoniae]